MKMTMTLLIVLSSFTAFASEMDIQKCVDKASKAAKQLASLEMGKNVFISESVQDSLSTATTFKHQH